MNDYLYSELLRAYQRFTEEYEQSNSYSNSIEHDVISLIDSVRSYIDDKSTSLACIISLGADLSLEIDFLEWLVVEKNQPMDLSRMPLTLFENMVDQYCVFADKSHKSNKKKLIKSFKQSNPSVFAKKLSVFLTSAQEKKMKGLGYIYNRYTNSSIPFRCYFLPLAAKARALEAFINTYWVDLDNLSGDHLDIYYSDNDIGKSGYAISKEMSMIPRDLNIKLPCIVLWQTDLRAARSIDIKDLLDEDLFRLFELIVEWIKCEVPFVNIVERSEYTVKQILDSRNPNTTNNITQYYNNNDRLIDVSGSKIINKEGQTMVKVKGNKAGNDIVTRVSDKAIEITKSVSVEENEANKSITTEIGDFSKDVATATAIINKFTDVDEYYRKKLVDFVNKANEAVQKQDEAAKTSCKTKFEGFIMGAGKVLDKILAALASVDTIAKFFGLQHAVSNCMK